MKGKSTSTNLIEFTSFAKISVEQGFLIDAMNTDFKKPLTRCHLILLYKMKMLGINVRTVNWIGSYLKDRQICQIWKLRIETYLSQLWPPTRWTLSALHFSSSSSTTYSNLLITRLSFCSLTTIKSMSGLQCRNLQKALNLVVDWSEINKLFLNPQKCTVTTFTRSKSRDILFQYKIGPQALERVSHVMELGILLDKLITFVLHMMLGFIIRCSKELRDPYTIKKLYSTYVRPILEYVSEVWCPYYGIHKQRIESVQKKFLEYAQRNLG